MEEEGGSILIYILFGIAYIVLQVVGAKKGKKPAHPPVPPQTIPDLEDSEDLPQDATWEEDEKSGMPVPPMPVPDRPVPVPEPETVTAAPFSYDDDITQDYFERARAEQKPENPGNNIWEKISKRAEALRHADTADTTGMTAGTGVLEDFDARKAILYAEILRPKFDGDQEADRF